MRSRRSSVAGAWQSFWFCRFAANFFSVISGFLISDMEASLGSRYGGVGSGVFPST